MNKHAHEIVVLVLNSTGASYYYRWTNLEQLAPHHARRSSRPRDWRSCNAYGHRKSSGERPDILHNGREDGSPVLPTKSGGSFISWRGVLSLKYRLGKFSMLPRSVPGLLFSAIVSSYLGIFSLVTPSIADQRSGF